VKRCSIIALRRSKGSRQRASRPPWQKRTRPVLISISAFQWKCAEEAVGRRGHTLCSENQARCWQKVSKGFSARDFPVST
jgi:hypothetical protein